MMVGLMQFQSGLKIFLIHGHKEHNQYLKNTADGNQLQVLYHPRPLTPLFLLCIRKYYIIYV